MRDGEELAVKKRKPAAKAKHTHARTPEGPRKQYQKWDPQDEMDRTTIYIPAKIHKELKVESAVSGVPISRIILDALRGRVTLTRHESPPPAAPAPA